MTDPLLTFSDALVGRVAAARPWLVSIHPGSRAQRTATLWRSGVLVTSEQGLPADRNVPVTMPDGSHGQAVLAGRDPGTNVAALRLELDGPALPQPAEPQAGALALLLGAAADGGPTARLALVHRVGPAWESMAGGRIDRLINLDTRLSGQEEGGPVLDAAGGLLGMSTLGPRRRVLVIPAATVDRVLAPLLAEGQVARGWLGLGLQPVSIPAAWQASAGMESGLTLHPRAVAKALGATSAGKAVTLRLLRGGTPMDLVATVAARPAA